MKNSPVFPYIMSWPKVERQKIWKKWDEISLIVSVGKYWILQSLVLIVYNQCFGFCWYQANNFNPDFFYDLYKVFKLKCWLLERING